MVDAIDNQSRHGDFFHKSQRSAKTKSANFLMNDAEPKCPYSHLAKNGVIEYNGVVFVCDYEHNTITLGDVESNPKKVLTIALPSGGNLKVNVDNLDVLAKAAGMFSPADLNAIMRAIQMYKHCTSKINEIEEEESKSPEEISKKDEPAENDREASGVQLKRYNEELYQKLTGEALFEHTGEELSQSIVQSISTEELEQRIELLLEDLDK